MSKQRIIGAAVTTAIALVMVCPIIVLGYVSILGGSVTEAQALPAFLMAIIGLIPTLLAAFLWSGADMGL